MIINNNSYRLLMTIMSLYIYILEVHYAMKLPMISQVFRGQLSTRCFRKSFRGAFAVVGKFFLDQNNL